MKKRMLSLLLAVALVLGLCPSVFAAGSSYADVLDTHWAHPYIEDVTEKGIMNGVDDKNFAPEDAMTRAMFVTVLYRMDGEPAVEQKAGFADVAEGSYYAAAVDWAAKNGIVNGVSETSFDPDAAITREQMAAILYRYAQSKSIDVSVGENTNILSYVDVQQASEYAIPALQWAVGAGVLNGKNGGRLAPTGTATRAEIAAIMQRWCENIIK